MTVADHDEIDAHVGALWADLLGVAAVKPTDSFFDLGGDSVLASVLMFRLEETYGAVLEPVELYEAPTLAAFSRRIRAIIAPGSVEGVREGAL